MDVDRYLDGENSSKNSTGNEVPGFELLGMNTYGIGNDTENYDEYTRKNLYEIALTC